MHGSGKTHRFNKKIINTYLTHKIQIYAETITAFRIVSLKTELLHSSLHLATL